jgi:hypothetical protein
MKNAIYSHMGYGSSGNLVSSFSQGNIRVEKAIELYEATVKELVDGGGTLLGRDFHSPAAVKVGDRIHLVGWKYVAPGYGDPENIVERVTVWMERIPWGWSYWRCVFAKWFGMCWYAGEKWPRRRRECC